MRISQRESVTYTQKPIEARSSTISHLYSLFHRRGSICSLLRQKSSSSSISPLLTPQTSPGMFCRRSASVSSVVEEAIMVNPNREMLRKKKQERDKEYLNTELRDFCHRETRLFHDRTPRMGALYISQHLITVVIFRSLYAKISRVIIPFTEYRFLRSHRPSSRYFRSALT